MGRRLREPPIRITWALDLLELTPADRVLEIGCGPGVAASLVADRLAEGSVTAIDRSPTAIARARARNLHHLESGRLALAEVALAEFRSESQFDKAFSVNVNVFWTTSAAPECEALKAVLTPRGVVHLLFEGTGDSGSDVSATVAANLGRHGFAASVRRGPQPALVCITGQREG
ncbi:MAG: trans-aconitate 2-methyltransferase [Acidimicrobiales bacterium]